MAQTLNIGDRLRLSGGYEHEPRWLHSSQSYMGTLMAFIPGQNEAPAAVVELDAQITAEGATGKILVLELRYTGATWKKTETVHVELCPFVPEARPWQERAKGTWIESHATYNRIEVGNAL